MLFRSVVKRDNISLDVYSSIVVQNKLYLSVYGHNALLKFDLETWEVEVDQLPGKYQLKNMNIISNKFWFTLVDSYNIIQYDPIEKNVKEYKNEYIGEKMGAYMRCIEFQNRILILPGAENHLAEIDYQEQKVLIRQELLNDEFERRNTVSALALGYEMNDSEVIIYPNAGTKMICWNKENKTKYINAVFIKGLDKLRKAIIDKRFKEKLENAEVITEYSDEIFSLNNFITYICDNQEKKQNIERTGIGEKIWKYLR